VTAPGRHARFLARVESLRAGLSDILRRRAVPAQVLGDGPMWQVVFTPVPIVDYRSSLGADRAKALALDHGLIENGVFVRPGGPHYFSMAHTDADVAATLAIVDRLLAAGIAS
jgi:glutamate-1-semialdehyde 2,1-aminomutase